MFNSLNDEIKRREAVETLTMRLLRYAGIIALSTVGFCALYVGILYLE